MPETPAAPGLNVAGLTRERDQLRTELDRTAQLLAAATAERDQLRTELDRRTQDTQRAQVQRAEVESRLDRDPPLRETVKGLRFMVAVCEGGGRLSGTDSAQAVQLLDTVGPFLRGVRTALDGGICPADDLQVRCAQDHVPHAMRYHAKHKAP